MTVALKKLERAASEINALDSYLKEQLARSERSAGLTVAFDHQSGKHQVLIANVPYLDDLRDDVLITVSVIVHLLRSASDNLAFDLAIQNTNGQIEHPGAV